nr:zinc finger, CCHC-type, retrotransposon Gag domain protein [Tanacetum cinerariifolium]
SIRQTSSETSTEFMQRFLRLAGFLGAAAGTEEEQAKNFQWGLRRSTLNYLMCMSYMDVAQVANVARNYEILHERDDDGTERPDKQQRSGDRRQPTSQQSSHRSHGHNNDRHESDRRGRGVVISISRPLSRVVTGATVIITTVMDLIGMVAMTTTAAATTTTTLAVLSNPGVPLRVTPIQFALLVGIDTKESVIELQ